MAIYRLSAQIIKRSTGRSACAASAYRAAARIADPRTGEVHDYRRRSGVDATHVFAPAGAPDWATDRARLWAEVENVERRRDAQLAREIQLALPVELGPRESGELVAGFVREQFAREGMIADVALHDIGGKNPHAHVMLTLREIGPEGFGKKQRAWNRTDLLLRWREAWAAHVNKALERAGVEARVDHRSLEAQGLDRLPQPKLGPAAAALEQKGIRTDRGDELRRVQQVNSVIERIDGEIRELAELRQLAAGNEDQRYEQTKIRRPEGPRAYGGDAQRGGVRPSRDPRSGGGVNRAVQSAGRACRGAAAAAGAVGERFERVADSVGEWAEVSARYEARAATGVTIIRAARDLLAALRAALAIARRLIERLRPRIDDDMGLAGAILSPARARPASPAPEPGPGPRGPPRRRRR